MDSNLLDSDDFSLENIHESNKTMNQYGDTKKTKFEHVQPTESTLDNDKFQSLFEPTNNMGNNRMVTSSQISFPSSLNNTIMTQENIFLIPELLGNALNTSNFMNLTSILETYFKIDCAVLFKSADQINGRNLIFQHYYSLLNKFSNCSFQYNVKSRHHRLLVIAETCVCEIFPTMFQHEERVVDLWRCFNIFNFESDAARLLYRKKFSDILYLSMNRLLVTFKVDLLMIVNDEMTQFESIMWELVSLKISEELFTDIYK